MGSQYQLVFGTHSKFSFRLSHSYSSLLSIVTTFNRNYVLPKQRNFLHEFAHRLKETNELNKLRREKNQISNIPNKEFKLTKSICPSGNRCGRVPLNFLWISHKMRPREKKNKCRFSIWPWLWTVQRQMRSWRRHKSARGKRKSPKASKKSFERDDFDFWLRKNVPELLSWRHSA